MMIDPRIQQQLRDTCNPDGSLRRNAQLRMLSILVEVDRICRKRGIGYWMDAGTLLGAVRHGGFIPWDDDLDICILKKDYSRFKKAMIEELPSSMAYQDWTTDKYHFEMSPRIRDLNSLFDQNESRMQKYRGLFLDVVLLEKMPSMKFHNFVYPLYGRVSRTIHNHGYVEGKALWRIFADKIAAFMLWPVARLLIAAGGLVAALKKSDLIGRYYSGFRNPRYLSQTFPLKDIEFEGHMFSAPGDSEGYLKSLFGDFMELPPEDQRGGHEVNIELYDGK